MYITLFLVSYFLLPFICRYGFSTAGSARIRFNLFYFIDAYLDLFS